MLLIDDPSITPSLRLGALGIQSVEDVHAGGRAYFSMKRLERIFGQPGRPWSATDYNVVTRLLGELRDSSLAQACLELLSTRSTATKELVTMERVNGGRVDALAQLTPILGLLWCQDDKDGVRRYETLFRGARECDYVLLDAREIRAHVALHAEAYSTLDGSLDAALVRVNCLVGEADKSRWLPATWNAFLRRRLGAAEARKFMALVSRPLLPPPSDKDDGGALHAHELERKSIVARCRLVDLLLKEYLPLMSKGRVAGDCNLAEDKGLLDRLAWKQGARRLRPCGGN
jgi:hypothetical protein